MTGLKWTVSDSSPRLEAALRDLIARAEDPRPALDEIGSVAEASIDRRFETETGPDGKPWKKSRRAAEENGQTLSLDGGLRQSITHNVIGNNAVEIGPSGPIYAAIHHFGGVIRAKTAKGLAFMIGDDLIIRQSVTLPARPYLGFDDGDLNEAAAIVDDYVMHGRLP